MGRGLSYSTATVAIAFAAIIIATAVLSYFSYYYTVGRENLIETSMVQSNIRLAQQFVDRIEQKIIDNDRLLAGLADVDSPARWPGIVEAIKAGEYGVEQVYFLRPGSDHPLYPPYSQEIRKSWTAFRNSFRLGALDLEKLAPNQAHHLHMERSYGYFFASYVLKENRQGERFVVCFQMDYEKVLALIDRYLRDLQRDFYVGIVDFDNNGVYNQPIPRSSKYFYETRFPTTFYKWILQIVPRNYAEIEHDARKQRRTYLFLIILSMSMILCSLAVIYAAGARERQLAKLQDDFISHVSHELKTPLSLISMFSEILLSGRQKNESACREYYGIIHRESERMARLVNNLLDFERLEHDRRAPRFERVDVAQLVDRELEGYRRHMQREDLHLVEEIAPDVPETLADPDAVATALFNLLDNAVKYGGDGGQIAVRVRCADGFVEISVADRGIGIPAEEQPRIFDKFYRGSNAAVARVRGSGIGLAISKRVAEMHGGEIRVESEPGKGSVFTIRIPVRAPDEGA